jgi:hypothetical protein
MCGVTVFLIPALTAEIFRIFVTLEAEYLLPFNPLKRNFLG